MENIGPYQILGELGRGAMAVVWRAHDPNLEREVAIKEPMIPPGTDAATGAELSARFVREGKAAAKLNHPGIVTIHAADIYNDRPAIVMELIEGQTLGELLEHGPLTVESALGVLQQLLDAVGFAHSHGVIHRDIKPDNIFVTSDGRVKLADFGIAHVGSSGVLTQAGTVMGTPGYMAPEQVTGQLVDARADLFAIGVVAWEMLTGENPFGATRGDAATTIMYRIVHESAPPLPAHVLSAIPFDFTGVLSVALAKDPQSRFADAQSFRSALAGGPIVTAAAVAQDPGRAAAPAPYSAVTVIGKPASARPSWLPYAIVVGVGAVIIGIFAVTSGPPASSNAGGNGNVVQAPAEPPPTIPADNATTEPVETGPTDAESQAYLQSVYTQITAFGDPTTGLISSLAKRFNADPLTTTGATSSTTQAARDLVQDIEFTAGDLRDTEVSATYAATKVTQLQLIEYCRIRADGILQACELSQYGGNIGPPLDAGRAAKNAYTALLPQGQP